MPATIVPMAAQLRMARYGLGLTTREVTEATGVSSVPLSKVESGKTVNDTTLIALINFYRTLGVDFRTDGSVYVPPEYSEERSRGRGKAQKSQSDGPPSHDQAIRPDPDMASGWTHAP